MLAAAVLLGGCGSGSGDALESGSAGETEDSVVELDPGTDSTDSSEEAPSEDDVVELDPGTDSTDTSSVEPPSEDDVVEADPGEEDSPDTSAVDDQSSGDGTEILDDLIQRMIGLPESDAISMARAEGYEVRIESRNGEEFALTQEFEENRFNLTIVDDVVESVRLG